MGTIFKEKKPFQKTYVILDTKEDLGIDSQEAYKFALWEDPSRQTIMKFLGVINTKRDELDEKSEEELEELNARFWESVSDIVIDCNIEGLSFDTPEEAEASFDAPHVDYGLMTDIVAAYVYSVLTKSRALKKSTNPGSKIVDSGERQKSEDKK